MSGLEIAASAVGISEFALRGLKTAYDFVSDMKDAPSEVRIIGAELETLQKQLKLIITKDDAVAVVRTIAKEMNLASLTKACAQTCEDFVAKLKKWMPNPENPTLLDRARVQAHRKDIRECRNVVQATTSTIMLAEVVTNRRLQVENYRAQGIMTEQLAELLQENALRSTRDADREAKAIAHIYHEQDQREEISFTSSQHAGGVAMYIASEEDMLALPVPDFGAMVEYASNKAVALSRTVVKQSFGSLEMGDENEYDEGVEGSHDGEFYQIFGDTKIGSRNKVRRGMFI